MKDDEIFTSIAGESEGQTGRTRISLTIAVIVLACCISALCVLGKPTWAAALIFGIGCLAIVCVLDNIKP